MEIDTDFLHTDDRLELLKTHVVPTDEGPKTFKSALFGLKLIAANELLALNLFTDLGLYANGAKVSDSKLVIRTRRGSVVQDATARLQMVVAAENCDAALEELRDVMARNMIPELSVGYLATRRCTITVALFGARPVLGLDLEVSLVPPGGAF